MKKDSLPKTDPKPLEETESTKTEPNKSKNEYLEIRIPKFAFHKASTNAYLVFVLIIFSFLLGMLTNKYLNLHTQLKKPVVAQTGAVEPTIDPNATPTPFPVVKTDVGKLPVLGEEKAKVTMIEFSDLQCPFCKRYFDDSHQQIIDKYVKTGKLKFAYRHYPLSFHPNAQKAGEAVECANDQNKFWEYHDLIFKNQETWSEESTTAVLGTFTNYAGELSLDTTSFRSCLDENKHKTKVETDATEGNRIGVSGTPTFVINGKMVVGAVPFSELQTVIEEELKK